MNQIASNEVRVLYDSDVATSDVRKNETIAVLGYGIQGRAQASNLADSGFKVIVGLRKGGKSWNLAREDGHKVMEIAEAAKAADIIHVLTPDMVQAGVYEEIAPHVTKGKGLSFSHGAAVHWGWIKPPTDVDVFMIAPKAPGQRVREVYLQGFGTPSLVAVYQDATGRAWQRALELAKGIGSTRAGVIKTTFREETESDWFGEQVDLCGGVDRLIRSAFEVLIERGYRPEIAYFECLHELKLIVDLIQRYGITGMYRGVSETARFGGLVIGPRIIDEQAKEKMRKALDEIQSGAFAQNWVSTYQREGQKAFEKYLEELDLHPIEQTGRKLRQMMFPDDTRTGASVSWSKLKSNVSRGARASSKKRSRKRSRRSAKKRV